MPYLAEKVRIEGTMLDRRRKLSEEDKDRLRQLREMDGTSYAKLGKMFGVSKRLAIFICRPDLFERHKARFKELRKDGRYYDRVKHNESVKKMRHYKHELLQNGLVSL